MAKKKKRKAAKAAKRVTKTKPKARKVGTAEIIIEG